MKLVSSEGVCRQWCYGCGRSLSYAVAACLMLAAGNAHTQTIPYRSQQRSFTGSDVGEQPRPDGLIFEPRLETSAQYFDNLNLAEATRDRVSSAGFELAPGLYASYKTPRFNGAIDASLIGRLWEDSDYNDLTGLLDASARWSAIQNVLFIDGTASYQTVVVDPAQGANYGGIGVYRNSSTSDVVAASVTPSFQKRLGDFDIRSSYSAGAVWYLDNQNVVTDVFSQDDSFDQRFQVSVGLADTGRPLSARVFYEWNRSEYDVSLPYELERIGADANWRITESLYLVADGGIESDLFADISAGGLDSDFWHAGFRWVPSSRTSVEFRFGQRFDDDSYSASVTHKARLLQFNASYSEEPTVESRRRSLGDGGSIDLDQPPIDLDNQPQTPPGFDFGAFDSTPYINKDGRVSVRAAGAKTVLEATAYRTRREYISALRPDENEEGVILAGSRRFTPDFSMDSQLIYRDYDRAFFVAPPGEPDLTHLRETQFVLRANQGFMERLTASAELGYFNRSGDLNTDGWWVALRLRYLPKFR